MNNNLSFYFEGQKISDRDATIIDLNYLNAKKINFVGIHVNKVNGVFYKFISFPKHYHVEGIIYPCKDIKSNIRHLFKLFEVLNYTKSKSCYSQNVDSLFNEVLYFFFEIFNYYQYNGLFMIQENENIKKAGVINWNMTIRRTSPLKSNKNYIYFNTWKKQKKSSKNIITYAMKLALNIGKKMFSGFLEEVDEYDSFQIEELDNIDLIAELYNEKKSSFTDEYQLLLASIISFFELVNDSESWNYTTQNFQKVWEVLNENFLNQDFQHQKEIFLGSRQFKNTSLLQERYKRKAYPDHMNKITLQIMDSKYYLGNIEFTYKEYVYALHNKLTSWADTSEKTIGIYLLVPSKNKNYDNKIEILMDSEKITGINTFICHINLFDRIEKFYDNSEKFDLTKFNFDSNYKIENNKIIHTDK